MTSLNNSPVAVWLRVWGTGTEKETDVMAANADVAALLFFIYDCKE